MAVALIFKEEIQIINYLCYLLRTISENLGICEKVQHFAYLVENLESGERTILATGDTCNNVRMKMLDHYHSEIEPVAIQDKSCETMLGFYHWLLFVGDNVWEKGGIVPTEYAQNLEHNTIFERRKENA